MPSIPTNGAQDDWVVISLGHRFRGDDGVGPHVLERLRNRSDDRITCIENRGDMTRLLDDWCGRRVCLVDAIADETRKVGDVLMLDGLTETWPPSAGSTSSHGLSLCEALELGHLLDALPAELHIYGICGADFSNTAEISRPVARAAAQVERQILQRCIAQTGGPRARTVPDPKPGGQDPHTGKR